MRPHLLVVVVLAAAGLVTGCSGGSAKPDGGTQDANPCHVLAMGATCDPTSKTEVCALTPEAGAYPSAICAPSSPGGSSTVCTASFQVDQGSDCSKPGSLCLTGAYCLLDAGKNICTNGAPVGMPCDAKLGCEFNAYCALTKGAKVGVCKTGGGAGASCTTSIECGQGAPYCVDKKCSAKSGGC
jgi:hypothetical protein